MCVSTAQARTKSGSRSRDPSGARHFPENSRINVSYDLEEVLVRRSCGDPDEIRCNPLRGPCIILYSSLEEVAAKILMKSSQGSLHDPVQVLVKRSCRDPDKFSSEGPCMILYRSLRRSGRDGGEIL